MRFIIFVLLQALMYMLVAGTAWQWVLGMQFSITKLFVVGIMNGVVTFTFMRAHKLTFQDYNPDKSP